MDKGIDVQDVHVTTPKLQKTEFVDKPWDGSMGRFSEEEFMRSCLIQGETKSQCKLPIREPNGVVNINAVRNALARLNQTQGGDHAKIKAKLESLLEEFKSKHGMKKESPIFKMDESKHLIYGVALVPDIEDLQNDVVTKEEIEAAAHDYMVNSRVIYKGHKAKADAEVVQSYIAPVDFPLGDQLIKEGSWVIVTHISDPKVWDMVKKGELQGYSIGGTGERETV